MQQLHNLQTVISALQTRQCMRPLTHERTKNYSQFQLSNLLFAYLCQQSLPTQQMVKKFRKTPEQFPAQ